jgi:excisionase family DNA binding protein
MGTAVTDGKIAANPCVIRAAGSAKRAVTIRPASIDELAKLTEAMPQRYRAMILLASWCALRFGELTELRRRDIDVEAAMIRVRRGVVRTEAGFRIATPKSQAGTRDVAIPPHLLPALRTHLVDHVELGQDSLLFPAVGGGHLAPSTFKRHFYRARGAAARPDLRFHDLRLTGAVLAALSGATLAELMARLGHSTPQAALRYQHAAAGRDKAIAARLSELAEAGRGCLICTPGWLIPRDIAWRTTYYSALWDLRATDSALPFGKHTSPAATPGALMMKNGSEAATRDPSLPDMSILDAADYLGVDRSTIRDMIDDGRLKAYKLGDRVIRLRRSEIDSALQPYTPGVAPAGFQKADGANK